MDFVAFGAITAFVGFMQRNRFRRVNGRANRGVVTAAAGFFGAGIFQKFWVFFLGMTFMASEAAFFHLRHIVKVRACIFDHIPVAVYAKGDFVFLAQFFQNRMLAR